MEHSFDVDVAVSYGIEQAVLLHDMFFWVKKNEANNTNFFNGRYWTFNSVKAFTELYPYMSVQKLRTTLKKLEENDLIMKGNFNKSPYDRTCWYTLTDKGLSICLNEKIHLLEITNENVANNKTIPYTYTDTNTDIYNSDCAEQCADSVKKTNVSSQDVENFFNKIWLLYPKKKGKGQVSKSQKNKLYRLGYDELSLCINRYVDENKGKDSKYIMHGSTFFNSGYIDYLDENWNESNNNVNTSHNVEEYWQ